MVMIKQSSKASGLSLSSQHSTSSDFLTSLSVHSTDTTRSDSSSMKRVKFARSVRAKKVMSRKMYTPDEHEKTWYDFDELEQIRLSIEREVQQVKDGVVIDKNGIEVNSRGLEAWVNINKIQTKSKKARDAVFQVQQQYQQQDIASFNCSMSLTSNSTISMSSAASADMIATAYAKEAKKSTREAQNVGINDAKVAIELGKLSQQEAEEELLERSCENRASAFLAARRQRMKQLASTAA